MKEIKKVSDIDGEFILEYVKSKNDIDWLKSVSKEKRRFIALRTEFVKRYDEFKAFRPKAKKKPLWQQIEEL